MTRVEEGTSLARIVCQFSCGAASAVARLGTVAASSGLPKDGAAEAFGGG